MRCIIPMEEPTMMSMMGVDLSLVLHAGGRKTKSIDGPTQIFLPFPFAQRKSFANRGFINLNDANAGSFQIDGFFADCQRDLLGGLTARLIIANK